MEDEIVALYPLGITVLDVDGDVIQMNVSTMFGGGSLVFEGQLSTILDNSTSSVNVGSSLVMDGTPEIITEMLKNIIFIPHKDFNGLEMLRLTAVDSHFATAKQREVAIFIEV